MESNTKKNKKGELISSIVIAAILFIHLVIASPRYMKYVYIILACSLAYTILLVLRKPKILKKLFSSYSFIWITVFAIEMFIYGYFGNNPEVYSLKFHLLNIICIFIVLIILYDKYESIKDVIAKSCAITTLLMSMYIILTGSYSFNTTGINIYTAVGNKNTTAISYIFLLIPIIYKIFIEKNKKYILISIMGIIFMLLTGSKKSIISLLLIIVIVYSGKTTYKNALKNITKCVLLVAIVMYLCYQIPMLHTIIWDRLESMIETLNNFNSQDQSSTGLRMNFLLTAFTKAWDRPFLGHGWGSFAQMYGYSSVYKTHLYTHNNYAEVLFSFGLLGLFFHYWFPIRIIIKTIKNKNTNTKTFCWLYIIILLFIDFGTVSCYSSILGYIGFAIAGLELNRQKNSITSYRKRNSYKIKEE